MTSPRLRAPPTEEAAAMNSMTPESKEVVVIVEDQEEIRLLIGVALEEAGYDVALPDR